MTEPSDLIRESLVAVLPALLATLTGLEDISRAVTPPLTTALLDRLGDQDKRLHDAVELLHAAPWPENLLAFRDQLALACTHAMRAADGMRAAPDASNPIFAAYRALRQTNRAVEALYPMANMLPPVSRFFLEPGRAGDSALAERLKTADMARDGVGVLDANNALDARGGFTAYVPEYLDLSRPTPIIFALHGGSGHGRLFLWNWVREARTRGIIVVAPTARGDTWSLMDPAIDSANLLTILQDIQRHYAIDPTRMLLTGMSDGGTFTLLSGLDATSPFTHLAPIAASFHPMLLAVSEPARIRNLPVYLVHGALDWMFPVSVGRAANQALGAAGARVTYREIADLSHTYPREENARILDWLLGADHGPDP